MTTVYIVCIGSKTLHPNTKIGSVHTDWHKAAAEVKRLQGANHFTTAWLVERELEMPLADRSACGWGHE